MALIKIIIGSCFVCGDQVVIVVTVDTAGEHVFPCGLIAAIADKPLFITIIENRNPAGEDHQRMGKADIFKSILIRNVREGFF